MPHLFVNTPSSMSEAGVTEAQKQHALKDCARELKDLNIDPAQLGKAEGAGAPKGKGPNKRL